MKTVFERLWEDNDPAGPRILTFLADSVDADRAKELVNQIGQINNFLPAAVCEAIDRCPADCQFMIGREGSPVIYVRISIWSRIESIAQVVTAFKPAKPDEYPPVEGYHSSVNTLRFWWD